ncbi:MAG: Membrane dipeptidase [Bacteroidetes bacterium]|nr:Membrane dipeptidase [Bacteroidota bacterium]
MRTLSVISLLSGILVSFLLPAAHAGSPDDQMMEKAKRLAKEYIIVDTHIDAPERMQEVVEDLSTHSKAQFDYVKAKEGGLSCGFMSIYLSSSYQKEKGKSKALAEKLIAMVERWTTRWPEKFLIARSVADVTAQFKTGKVSLAMGMENGSGIEDNLANVRYFYDKGIRYVTLTHAKDNLICDSSYDTTGTWHGLSPFGRKVVEEMNRVGIMVDISHVSDSAFYQVMRIGKAPAIASHSSCRYFTPGFERNMSDEMIKLLASKGGVIQINFGSSFINNEYRLAERKQTELINDNLKGMGISPEDSLGKEYDKKYREEHPTAFADVSEVAAHIDHVVKLVGVGHVGFGSDFDGVGDSLPTGLKDVSGYPNLIYELLKRGYRDEDIRKICSGNLLRVWSEVERTAKQLQKGG